MGGLKGQPSDQIVVTMFMVSFAEKHRRYSDRNPDQVQVVLYRIASRLFKVTANDRFLSPQARLALVRILDR